MNLLFSVNYFNLGLFYLHKTTRFFFIFPRFFGRIADSNTVHDKDTLVSIKQNAKGLKSRSLFL